MQIMNWESLLYPAVDLMMSIGGRLRPNTLKYLSEELRFMETEFESKELNKAFLFPVFEGRDFHLPAE